MVDNSVKGEGKAIRLALLFKLILGPVVMTLHGILWHLMLIFVGFVIIFSHEADLTTRGFLRTLPLFAFFCLAAEVLNGILHLFSAANLFYISPWEMSTQLLFAISIGYSAVR